MSYQDIDLAKLRVNEALKMGLESQRAYREMPERKLESRKKNQVFLRTMILTVRCSILEYGERLYCRMLGFMHFRPACP
jgi:hypothetical protein